MQVNEFRLNTKMSVVEAPAALAAVARECHTLEQRWTETLQLAEAEHARQHRALEVFPSI